MLILSSSSSFFAKGPYFGNLDISVQVKAFFFCQLQVTDLLFLVIALTRNCFKTFQTRQFYPYASTLIFLWISNIPKHTSEYLKINNSFSSYYNIPKHRTMFHNKPQCTLIFQHEITQNYNVHNHTNTYESIQKKNIEIT